MGHYNYTDDERVMNKVLKYQQDELNEMDRQLSTMRDSVKGRISESEELLRSLGYSPERTLASAMPQQSVTPVAVTESWEEIVLQAETQYPFDIEFEDLLTQAEFQNAYRDLNNINREFRQKTALNGVDAAFVVVAAALQTLRWILMNFIDSKVNNVTRLTDKQGEDLVQKKKKEFLENHSNWAATKKQKGRRLRQAEGMTWKEIVFMKPVPYDVMEGGAGLNLGLGGTTHRYKTPGHDPVLGWFFGTIDILSYVITLNSLISYKIQRISNRPTIIPGPILLPQVILEAVEQVREDIYKLPAAIFRQAAHFGSDIYTKRGLPVPFLGVFDENLAGKLYLQQYDFLRFAKDTEIPLSGILSCLINMVIGLVHGLFYKSERIESRELYEVRTRKILLYSNSLASAGNVAAAALTKNAKILDIGGLIVTISRLYSDTRFIARAKEQFIQDKLDQQLQQILNDADEMLYTF